MKVLIACEFSGTVRRAFASLGHYVTSCDLLPSTDNSPYHYVGDVFDIIDQGYDLMIAHPPCTYLASSGLHWNNRIPGRSEKTEEAIEFVRKLMDAPVGKIAVENPIGCISTRIRKPDQIIQPYNFGEDASKATCLWLKGLPCIKPTKYVQPRMVDGKKRWSNQTNSGQNKLTPSSNRWAERSITYPGIAEAMANQWGINDTAFK